MTDPQRTSYPRWRVLLLAALTALAALLLPAATASAAAPSAAETRVGAVTLAGPDIVGVHECITAGQRPVRGPSQLQVVSGHCVAAEAGGGGGGRAFTHFTDEAGATGITGARSLNVGESQVVSQLHFAKGQNPYIIGEGRIGVTDLGLDATPGQLNRIGVFGDKQQYAIQFSELDAFNSGVRVAGDLPSRNIFSIPGGCTITGTCTVARVR